MQLPTVTIVIAAKNEEHAIETRLNNLFGLDYSWDKLEIVVVSDGSTDRTNEILKEYYEFLLHFFNFYKDS